MGDFDNTKRAIGVGKLDDSQRKDMFNKFKSAGGEVIKEKTPAKEDDNKKSRPEPKVRQGSVSRGSDEGRSGSRGGGSSSQGRSPSKEDANANKSQLDSKAQFEKEISSFSARFSIKLKCWLARVTPFGSSDLTPKFMHDFSIRAKQALIELQYSGNELLANQQYSPQLSKTLDRINPLLVELLAMGQRLYNGPELTDITEPIMTAPESPVAIERVRNQIYSLFKRMYILYPYQETLKKSFTQAYDELQKLEGKPSLIYANKKRKVLQEIDTLFDGFFDRLYLVVIRAENKNIPLISRYMETLLGITPEDKPGQRKSGENVPGGKQVETKEERDAENAAKEEEKKEEEVPLSKEQAYGLRLMQMYSIPKLRKKFDPKNEYINIPDADKALLSLFYFYEFDDEYSFVMTTKKIDIKPGSLNGVKVDYRQKMLDIYESTRTIIDQFRIYHDILRELEKHKANPGVNYIEASKKLTGIEQKRTGQSRTVRLAIKEFSLKSRDALLVLIKDMKGKKEIVANMNDVLTLDSMESRKRLNKKPVKQCIMEAYCYLLALHDRIETGDLFGGLVELTPEQMKSSFGVDMEVAKESDSPDASELEGEPKAELEGKNPTTEESLSKEETPTEQTNDSLEDLSDDDILPTGNPF
ncbi:hypothetical protein EHQ59_05380 [Leptospira kemamanensis]|uniref:Uncharacterized protein n=1 Tax=Leptospira kemamanensis TaxID=2484942 RepID=A0A4V3JQC3_9LEPT|nr:hypothetical protein [Leptospira kemamanensis]TGL55040.1 hypothetical protein EHQ59_05380 [Leptospira kemamanensis]